MKSIGAVVNIAGVVALFFAFIVPVGRIVFSDTGGRLVIRAMLWLGIYRVAEPGDLLVEVSLLLSFLLAVSVVCLASLLINQRNRKNAHGK
jgi:hypothetical protein